MTNLSLRQKSRGTVVKTIAIHLYGARDPPPLASAAAAPSAIPDPRRAHGPRPPTLPRSMANSKRQTPSAKLQAPSSKLQTPNSKLQAPNSKLQAPNSRGALLGFHTTYITFMLWLAVYCTLEARQFALRLALDVVIRTSCPIVSPQLRIRRIFQAPDCLKLDYKAI